MCVVVTGKVAVPDVPSVNVPDCVLVTVTDWTPAMVSVNAAEVTPSIVSVRLCVFATTDALPVRVNVPLPLAAIVTFPAVTVFGRLFTVTEYEPLEIPAEVTAKVAVPPIPSVIEPLCEFVTDTPFIVNVNSAEVVLLSMVSLRLLYVPGTVEAFPVRVKVPVLLLMLKLEL